jgi:serine/threonine-protein kinase
MAPEQFHGADVTRQTDLFAFSVVLWELATGARLFAGENEAEIVGAILRESIPSPTSLAPDIPSELEAVILRGLASNPQDRWRTAREMCVALGQCGTAASALSIGDWVENLATRGLADRARKVQQIESSSGRTEIGFPPLPSWPANMQTSPPAGSSPPGLDPPRPSLDDATSARTQGAGAVDGAQVTGITTSIDVMFRKARRRAWIGVAAGILVLVGGIAIVLLPSRKAPGASANSRPSAAVAPAPEPPPFVSAAPPPAPEPVRAAPRATPPLTADTSSSGRRSPIMKPALSSSPTPRPRPPSSPTNGVFESRE